MTDAIFEAAVRQENSVPVIDLAGDVDRLAESGLDRAFKDATASGAGMVVLNFARVTYINSTGIALIVSLLARARTTKLTLLVCGLSEHYEHIFNITRLSDFMSIHRDETTALAVANTAVKEG
jgi:anti-anti-sigma factor